MKYFYKLLLLVSISLAFFACETSNGTDPDLTADELTQQGWDKFETGDYSEALDNFEKAIEKDNQFTDAHNGAGWASGRLTLLSDGASFFNNCLSLEPNYTDAIAGLAFIKNAQKEYQQAINMANNLLSVDDQWVFGHDTDINYRDLHLVLAECYFAILDFQNALNQVQKLDPSFGADLDLSTYEGRAALAAKIERLKGSV